MIFMTRSPLTQEVARGSGKGAGMETMFLTEGMADECTSE